MQSKTAKVVVCTALVASSLLVSGTAFAQTTTKDIPATPINNTYSSTTTNINATVPTSVPDVPNTGAVQQNDVSTTTMVIAIVAFLAVIGLLLFIAARRPEMSTTMNRFEDRR